MSPMTLNGGGAPRKGRGYSEPTAWYCEGGGQGAGAAWALEPPGARTQPSGAPGQRRMRAGGLGPDKLEGPL